MRGPVRVFVGLGSNLGDRAGNIDRAIEALVAHDAIDLTARSAIREYPAEGGPPGQNVFLNCVVEIATILQPQELLDHLLDIERSMGRPPPTVRQPWQGRTIDLDLLLYGRDVIVGPDIVVPHPRLHRRRFALEPLCELAPDLVHPVLGKTMAELLQEVSAGAT